MLSAAKTVVFDPALQHKYSQPLPRYTSYPPATEMTEDFSARDFEAAIAVGNYKQTPLSLHCHIPCQLLAGVQVSRSPRNLLHSARP
ncbi:MAG: hypothetical protein KME14_18455 [Tildeniella torsiva UHER 1998/13D]|jgi:oxygen-independent coproporphyrinogen-3 oxidase|nr:hypothetical protein [Tildeniella torsiva UHER 1998/13D]